MSVHDEQAPERADALAEETWHWIATRLERDRRLVEALVRAFAEELMAIEVDARCRSASGERLNRRNGYRSGAFATPSGTVLVRVPKLRHGGYAPAWLAGDTDGTDGAFVGALLRGYVEGMSADLVDGAAAAIGIDDLTADRAAALAAAMNARIYAEHVRPLLDVHGDDVVIETRRRASDGDIGVGIATTSVHGELDVLGLVIGEHGTDAVDQELRHDLARRGLRGEVPSPEEPAPAPLPRRDITIVVRRHGRGADPLDELDEPADEEARAPRRRIPLLLAAAAVVALIAAVVVGSTAVGRLRSDPDPAPVTTVVPVTVDTPTTVAPSVPAPAVPPTVTTTPVPSASECGPTTGTSRVPWMDQVQCEATAQPGASAAG